MATADKKYRLPQFTMLRAISSALGLICVFIVAVIVIDPAVVTYYGAPAICAVGDDLVLAFKEKSPFDESVKYTCLKKGPHAGWHPYFHFSGDLGGMACLGESIYLFRRGFYSIYRKGEWGDEPRWEKPWPVMASAAAGGDIFVFGLGADASLSAARLGPDGWDLDLPRILLPSARKRLAAAAGPSGCLVAFDDPEDRASLRLVRFAGGEWGEIRTLRLPRMSHFTLCYSEGGMLLFYARPEGRIRQASHLYCRTISADLQAGPERPVDEKSRWPRRVSGIAAIEKDSTIWVFATGLSRVVANSVSDGEAGEPENVAERSPFRRIEFGFWYGLILLLPALFLAVAVSILRAEEMLWLRSTGSPPRRYPMWVRRGLAQAIDLPLVVPLYLMAASLRLGTPAFARLAIFVGLALTYMSVTELLFQQSLGKAICGVAVVGAFGQKPSALTCVVRNLVRVIDFLPVLYVVGLISMRLGGGRRLGDLCGGSRVVRWESGKPLDPALRF